MNEAALTLEGWYVLHDLRSIDWNAWKALDGAERKNALDEFNNLWQSWKKSESEGEGATVVYTVTGHKADIMIIHLRERMETLNELETELDKTALAACMKRTYSYVSVVELSNYLSKPGTDPMDNPEVRARLKPIPPATEHVCFYPMNKRRSDGSNWYMLSMDERRAMMRSHGMIGRKYAGKVRQIITGSVGFDDWEWGVTLFADDPLQFKKLVYEMRFDEVSARYGEFGEFYVGNRLDEERLERLLEV